MAVQAVSGPRWNELLTVRGSGRVRTEGAQFRPPTRIAAADAVQPPAYRRRSWKGPRSLPRVQVPIIVRLPATGFLIVPSKTMGPAAPVPAGASDSRGPFN